MPIKWNPKKYFYKGRTLEWGKDLTQKQIKSLRQGEVFMLLDENKKLNRTILMDSYNQIRERRVDSQCKWDIAIKGLNI